MGSISRVARKPIVLQNGLDVAINDLEIVVKGKKGQLKCALPASVQIKKVENSLEFAPKNDSREANMLAGTLRATVQLMVIGVTEGYEKKLVLKGTGYKAQAQGKVLNLSLGFSHPVVFAIPEGISIETPTPTEIIIKGIDKQQLGQVAVNIRGFRPPECYKGKGIHYFGEVILMKETKKK